MEIQEDRWLSEIFGHGVFRVELGDGGEERSSSRVRNFVWEHAIQQNAGMYYSRVDTSDVDSVWHLSSAGLCVVEASVRFGLQSSAPLKRTVGASGPPVSLISPKQHDDVLEIAATCFRFSRFHLDPWISANIANRVKHDWVLSYIRKQRGDGLLVATVADRPVGFLAALISELDGRRLGVIDLMGVSPGFQNQGVGKALIRFFIDQYWDRCEVLQVGTQGANIPSIRLYQSAGFSIVGVQYAMHLHTRDGVNVANPNEYRKIKS